MAVRDRHHHGVKTSAMGQGRDHSTRGPTILLNRLYARYRDALRWLDIYDARRVVVTNADGKCWAGGDGSSRFRRDQQAQRLAERRCKTRKLGVHRIPRLDIMMELVTVSSRSESWLTSVWPRAAVFFRLDVAYRAGPHRHAVCDRTTVVVTESVRKLSGRSGSFTRSVHDHGAQPPATSTGLGVKQAWPRTKLHRGVHVGYRDNLRLTQNLDGEGVSDSISLRGREMESNGKAPRWLSP